jgi:hypothetical protein
MGKDVPFNFNAAY